MVTWSQLGMVAVAFIVAAMGFFGILMVFGGMMSSAPVEGEATSRKGCALFVAAIVLLIVGLLVLS